MLQELDGRHLRGPAATADSSDLLETGVFVETEQRVGEGALPDGAPRGIQLRVPKLLKLRGSRGVTLRPGELEQWDRFVEALERERTAGLEPESFAQAEIANDAGYQDMSAVGG